jgi:hypothetical protein
MSLKELKTTLIFLLSSLPFIYVERIRRHNEGRGVVCATRAA